jgi:hypothetical protein
MARLGHAGALRHPTQGPPGAKWLQKERVDAKIPSYGPCPVRNVRGS